MSSLTRGSIHLILLPVMVLLIMAITAPVNCSPSEKLDESSVTVAPDSGRKYCTATGCSPNYVDPYNQRPPPTPPPPPPPPKTESRKNCPPPPAPPSFTYMTGIPGSTYMTAPPGKLYPSDPYYSGAGRNSIVGRLAVLVGLVGVLVFLVNMKV